MRNDYREQLENGKRITEEICQILKDNDIKLYNRYIDIADSFKWEMMTYLAFQIGQFKTLKEAVMGFIEKYNNRGAKSLLDEIDPCCSHKNFDIKGEDDDRK